MIGNRPKKIRFVFATKAFDRIKRAFICFCEVGSRGLECCLSRDKNSYSQ